MLVHSDLFQQRSCTYEQRRSEELIQCHALFTAQGMGDQEYYTLPRGARKTKCLRTVSEQVLCLMITRVARTEIVHSNDRVIGVRSSPEYSSVNTLNSTKT